MIQTGCVGFGTAPRALLAVPLSAIALGLGVVARAEAGAQTSAAVPVYRSILSEKADYHGPGRDQPDPEDIPDVRIGFFAPRDLQNSVGLSMWRGATLAIEEANAKGGYRGKPFELVSRWGDNPWSAGAREMSRLVYEDKVWAVIGSINGAATHVAEQVATKARVTLLSPLSGDSSLTHTAVPWMFRLPPDDTSVAEALARIAVEETGARRIVLLTSSDHDGRAGAAELLSVLWGLRTPPVLHLSFDPSQSDFSQQLDRVSSASADAVFLWGLPEPSVRLLTALRQRGIKLPVFGPPIFSLSSFIHRAGGASESLTTCRLAWKPDTASWEKFTEQFQESFGEKPTDDAALGYDAASIIIKAVREAGLNRARIRDAVAGISGFVGLAGKVVWDNGGGNIATPLPVRFRDGRLREIQN